MMGIEESLTCYRLTTIPLQEKDDLRHRACCCLFQLCTALLRCHNMGRRAHSQANSPKAQIGSMQLESFLKNSTDSTLLLHSHQHLLSGQAGRLLVDGSPDLFMKYFVSYPSSLSRFANRCSHEPKLEFKLADHASVFPAPK